MDVSQKFKLLQAIQQREKKGNMQRTKLILNALITENILLELGKYKEILAQVLLTFFLEKFSLLM